MAIVELDGDERRDQLLELRRRDGAGSRQPLQERERSLELRKQRNHGRRIHGFECRRPARREREQRRLPDANPLERQHGRWKSPERAQRHQRVLHLRIATRGKVPLTERDALDDQLALTRQFCREQTGQKRRVGDSVLGRLAHLMVVRIRDVDPADATFPQPSVCGRDEPSVIQLQFDNSNAASKDGRVNGTSAIDHVESVCAKTS